MLTLEQLDQPRTKRRLLFYNQNITNDKITDYSNVMDSIDVSRELLFFPPPITSFFYFTSDISWSPSLSSHVSSMCPNSVEIRTIRSVEARHSTSD